VLLHDAVHAFAAFIWTIFVQACPIPGYIGLLWQVNQA
jgi:hypothetical protein